MVEIIVPASVEALGSGCFSVCGSRFSVTFESWSRLPRIAKQVFIRTDLIEIIFPSSAEALGDECFSDCRSLSSVIFASESRVGGGGQNAFSGLPIRPTLPTNI
jgi:hypothetical protein